MMCFTVQVLLRFYVSVPVNRVYDGYYKRVSLIARVNKHSNTSRKFTLISRYVNARPFGIHISSQTQFEPHFTNVIQDVTHERNDVNARIY